MLKGICITGLDGNFATKADILMIQGSQTQLVLEFEDESTCSQFINRNRNKLYQMSVGFPQESPKTFTHKQMSQEQLEMREFSFGKSTPPEDDPDGGDSGSSPSLNVFYSRPETNIVKPRVDLSIVKEEMSDQVKLEFQQESPKVPKPKVVLTTCKATSNLIMASFDKRCKDTPCHHMLSLKQKKKLKKMFFSSDDLMFLASQLQLKNKIQSFRLNKPTDDIAEIMCTKCEAKIEFHLKDDQEDKYKMSIKNSQLKHNKDMHPEVLK